MLGAKKELNYWHAMQNGTAMV